MTACETCGARFEPKQKHGRFCSPSCRQQAYRGRALRNGCVTPLRNAVPLRNVTDGDFEFLHDIGSRLDRGKIDRADVADTYDRVDRILQTHEAIVILANQLTIRLEKMEGRPAVNADG